VPLHMIYFSLTDGQSGAACASPASYDFEVAENELKLGVSSCML
jgi:hypothetical protein